MRTDIRVEGNNKIGIACYGEDVIKNQNCKRVEILGKQFKVISSSLSYSFIQTPVLWLQLDVKSKDEIPLGEVIVIE